MALSAISSFLPFDDGRAAILTRFYSAAEALRQRLRATL
jgi:hypothetical protein